MPKQGRHSMRPQPQSPGPASVSLFVGRSQWILGKAIDCEKWLWDLPSPLVVSADCVQQGLNVLSPQGERNPRQMAHLTWAKHKSFKAGSSEAGKGHRGHGGVTMGSSPGPRALPPPPAPAAFCPACPAAFGQRVFLQTSLPAFHTACALLNRRGAASCICSTAVRD